MITWADVIRGILKGLEWITADFLRFVVVMIIIFFVFFWLFMRKGLNIDDRLHATFTVMYVAIFICLMMMMANNGVLDTFFSTIV